MTASLVLAHALSTNGSSEKVVVSSGNVIALALVPLALDFAFGTLSLELPGCAKVNDISSTPSKILFTIFLCCACIVAISMSVPDLDVAALVKLALSSFGRARSPVAQYWLTCLCVCVFFFVFVLVGLMINGFSKNLTTGDR